MAVPRAASEKSNQTPNSPRVRILEDVVVNQIAAGEVVERPASVVKELVENAIDAHATEITVVIENGGRSSIEVIDNGCGMTKGDALQAIERYGTSKIRKANDIESIATLGFRGEAIPSIASVSQFSLATKQAGADEQGVEIRIHGGRLKDVQERELPAGTKVSVKRLFFNVPARRRFLRTEKTEAGQVRTLLTDFAAAYPQHRFVLVVDGKEVARHSPADGFLARATELKLGGKLPVVVEHSYETPNGPVAIEAVLSAPTGAVSASGSLRLIVNGRAVRDRLLLKAVRDGYGNFLKAGKFPSGALKLTIPPSEVDVNVHPQKTEVRFRAPQAVFSFVAEAIQAALSERAPMPKESYFQSSQAPLMPLHAKQETQPSPTPEFSGSGWLERTLETPKISQSEPASAVESHEVEATPAAVERTQPQVSDLRFVGQIMNCYLLLEGAGKLVIVDMHAAHERVRFYQLKREWAGGTIVSQQLLLPEVVELPADRLEQFELSRPVLKRLGFDCEIFGDDSVAIRALPAVLGNASAKGLFEDLLAAPEWSNWARKIDQRIDDVIARLACHSSIRSGRELEAAEAYALLDSLDEVETSGLCPHGRPVAKEISQDDLEAMFGRTGF